MSLSSSQRVERAQNSLKKAVATLHADEPGWLRGYEAERLLWTVLFEIDTLVELLNDGAEYDDLRRFAGDIGVALRRRHVALKMANTEGRTSEEAAAFDTARKMMEPA